VNFDLVVLFEYAFGPGRGIHKNAIGTLDEFAVLDKPVNEIVVVVAGDNVGMLAGNATVIENDIVFLRPPDRVRAIRF